jgi:hypothetical protein
MGIRYEITSQGGGGGGVSSASNLGTGTGIFASLVGADLQFKSLVAGDGIGSIPATATEVTINAVPRAFMAGLMGA